MAIVIDLFKLSKQCSESWSSIVKAPCRAHEGVTDTEAMCSSQTQTPSLPCLSPHLMPVVGPLSLRPPILSHPPWEVSLTPRSRTRAAVQIPESLGSGWDRTSQTRASLASMLGRGQGQPQPPAWVHQCSSPAAGPRTSWLGWRVARASGNVETRIYFRCLNSTWKEFYCCSGGTWVGQVEHSAVLKTHSWLSAQESLLCRGWRKEAPPLGPSFWTQKNWAHG